MTTAFLLLISVSAVSLVLYSHQAHDAHHEAFGGRAFGFDGLDGALAGRHGRTKHVQDGEGGRQKLARAGGQARHVGGRIDWRGEFHADREDREQEEAAEEEDGEEEVVEEEEEEDRDEAWGKEHERAQPSGRLDTADDENGHGHVGKRQKTKASARVVSRQWVSQAGRAGAYAYNHMAMVSRLKNGTLLASWQASAMGEGKPDQALRLAHGRLTELGDDSSITWGKAFPAPLGGPGDAKGGVVWSPVTHVDRDGRVFLFYTQSTPGCRAPGGDVKLVVYSPDEETWSQPRTIYGYADGRINKVIANKLVVTSSGTWVLPFWRELGPCRSTAQVEPTAGVLVSKDRGATWKPHGHIAHASTWLIEQTVVETTAPGGSPTLLMLCRTAANHVFRSTSKDDGRSWSTAEPIMNLPNPNAKIAALGGLGGGGGRWIVMVLNDHKELPQPYRRCRTKLRVVGSVDGGKKWERLASVEETLKPGLRYHYPTLMTIDGDMNHGADELDEARVGGVTGDFVLMYSTFFMKGFSKGGVKEGINSVVLRLTLP